MSALVLMSFGMTFLDVHTSITTFVAERAWPKDRTEVFKRTVTMIQVLLFQNLFRGSCDDGTSATVYNGQMTSRTRPLCRYKGYVPFKL